MGEEPIQSALTFPPPLASLDPLSGRVDKPDDLYASGCDGAFASQPIRSIDKSMDIGLGWDDLILCRKCFQAWVLRIVNGLFRVGRSQD